MMMMMTIKP